MPLLAPGHTIIPDLSVVILNWNACDYLVDALQSIVRQEWQHTIEVIVVDNYSTIDDSVETVQRDFPMVNLIAHDRNIGFSGGNNLGYHAARGRHILFLNPDTVVHDYALDILADWMDAHPNVGACGPKLLNPDGSLQPSCRAFPSIGAGFFRNTFLGRLFPNNPWTRSYLMLGFSHEKEAEVDWLSGSALWVRREAYEQVGGWDEDYFMYCEDVDLCYRLKEASWKRCYVPQAIITHRIGGSSDWAQGAMIRQHHGSMLLFFRKHYAHGLKILLLPIATVGIGLRALGAVIKLYRSYFRNGIPIPKRSHARKPPVP
jgi:GT2 family glycosyltransferase